MNPKNSFRIFAASIAALLVWSAVATAGTTTFGPSAYLQTGDTPAGFWCPCIGWIEDFELNSVDPFLTIDNGEILEPNTFSGLMNSVTDSVDGDNGPVDGLGNSGHSWFTGASNPDDNQVTISFATPVKNAGLVFTDGDSSSTNVKLEAFDSAGNSLAVIDGGDLADDMFTGQTAEDTFLGFQNTDAGIASIQLSINAGIGIEIDHVHWQEACPVVVPEPASYATCFMALVGLAGLRRRREDG